MKSPTKKNELKAGTTSLVSVKGSARFGKAVTGFFLALRPPPKQTVSQWADENRVLSSEASAEPGRWSTDRAPYLRGVMDAINDPEVKKIVCSKGSQIGWTETINNFIAYFIARDPAPILMIQPTLEMAQAWSKDRFAPMLRDTPALRGKVRDAKTRDADNTILHKSFTGGHITAIGANSPSGLASRPIRLVFADEPDRYPPSAGKEGDPLTLAAKRQITFWNKKTVLGSTPTNKDTSVIDREYKLSDMRRYFIPCHACGHMQYLQWKNVRWDKTGEGKDKAHHPETAHYACEECSAAWDDVARIDALSKGEWRATSDKPFSGTAGFHVPGLLSPWLTLQEIVKEFIDAKDDPALLQPFINTILGEVWEEKGETLDPSSFIGRREAYDHESLPDEAITITAGVDTQDDRIEVQFVAWGAREESWPCLYEIIRGDPSQPQVWKELDELLLRQFFTDQGRVLRLRAACIDSGGHHSAAVLSFTKTRKSRHIYAIKGQAGARPIWPKRSSKAKTSETIFMIGVDSAKEALYGRLKITKPGPAYVHFPHAEEFDEEYFAQLTAETVVTRVREGRPVRVWVPRRARNEALDTFVYAHAALRSTKLKLDTDKEQATPRNDAYHDRPQRQEKADENDNLPSVVVAAKNAPARTPRRSGSLFGGSLLGKRRGLL